MATINRTNCENVKVGDKLILVNFHFIGFDNVNFDTIREVEVTKVSARRFNCQIRSSREPFFSKETGEMIGDNYSGVYLSFDDALSAAKDFTLATFREQEKIFEENKEMRDKRLEYINKMAKER